MMRNPGLWPTERAESYSLLGQKLLAVVASLDPEVDELHTRSLLDQNSYIAGMFRRRFSFLEVAAVSLLCCKYPIQVCGNKQDVSALVSLAFPPLPEVLPDYVGVKDQLLVDSSVMRRAFPLKKHPGAKTKVNVYTIEVLEELAVMGVLPHFAEYIHVCAGRVFADQLTGALIHAYGCSSVLGGIFKGVSFHAILEPKAAKGLSMGIKALGLNGIQAGAMVCECDVLQGRAVGSADLEGEVAMRTSETAVLEHVLDVDEDALRRVVREILQEELPRSDLPVFDDLTQFWLRRWVWGVNGSHNRVLDNHSHGETPDMAKVCPGVSRYYRRMFLEATPTEVISNWDGTTFVTASEKLECGKTRALMACDTRSYCAFEHILGPVQKRWANKRVVLDPGFFGQLGMSRKVLACRSAGGVNVMMDYDSFNEHHTNKSQAILFDELAKWCNYPPHLASTLVASFDKQFAYLKGKLHGRVTGTLMSGHRGTSFINSVLNAAYIRLAIGEGAYRRVQALHVGDDVYMAVPSLNDASAILDKCRDFGCRMNPSKQSIGFESAEFLRVAITSRGAWGYLARGVASAVAGNWVNESKLEPREALSNGIATARTLINRSGGCVGMAKILHRSYARMARISRPLAHKLLSGVVALEGGPVWASCGSVITYNLVEDMDKGPVFSLVRQRGWPLAATADYLSAGCSTLERLVLERTGYSVLSAMADSSYKKALLGVDTVHSRIKLTRNKGTIPVGAESALKLLFKPRVAGVLEGYPILHIIRKQLSKHQLMEAVADAGGDPHAADLDAVAWGAEGHTVVVDGTLPYADASMLASRTAAGVIHCNFPVNV
jgi:hypothetical protein